MHMSQAGLRVSSSVVGPKRWNSPGRELSASRSAKCVQPLSRGSSASSATTHDHRVDHLGLPVRRAFVAGGPAVLGDVQRQMRLPRGRQLGVTVMTQRPFDSGREVGRPGRHYLKGAEPGQGLK
ncbi:hypothetical protein ACPCKW_11700 [Streptomyces griseoincarnatus]